MTATNGASTNGTEAPLNRADEVKDVSTMNFSAPVPTIPIASSATSEVSRCTSGKSIRLKHWMQRLMTSKKDIVEVY